MPVRIPMLAKRVPLAIALALMVGCQPLGVTKPPTAPEVELPSIAKTVVSNLQASLSGVVTGPSHLVANNAAGLVANNAAGYRTMALAMGTVPHALVYLTNPNEQFYAGADGKALFALTDENGAYSFAKAPAGVPVIVTVLLEKNRRLVGFLNPAKGANAYDVDLATTVVTEFLRDQARLSNRTMADFPALATELPGIVELTRKLLADGKMHFRQQDSDPSDYLDLSVNGIPAMCHDYVRAFAASNKALSDAWTRLLGHRPLLIEDLDVGQPPGMQLIAVAASGETIYTAAINNSSLVITETASGSAPRTLVSTERVAGIDYIGGMTASGSMLYLGAPAYGQLQIDTTLPQSDLLIDTSSGATGSNFVSGNSGFNPGANGSAYDLLQQGDWLYLSSPLTNELFRYHLDAKGAAVGVERVAGVSARSQDATFFNGDAPANGAQVRLNVPTGLAYREVGGQPYLYFADTLNHRIRRTLLSSPSFTTETVLGTATTVYGHMLKPPGLLEDGKIKGSTAADLDDPRGVPRQSASLFFPKDLLFDGAGRMFIADNDHRRIRMFDGTRVYTVAGTVAGAPMVTGDSRRSGLGEVASIALDASGNVLVADMRSNRLRRLRLPFGL